MEGMTQTLLERFDHWANINSACAPSKPMRDEIRRALAVAQAVRELDERDDTREWIEGRADELLEGK